MNSNEQFAYLIWQMKSEDRIIADFFKRYPQPSLAMNNMDRKQPHQDY